MSERKDRFLVKSNVGIQEEQEVLRDLLKAGPKDTSRLIKMMDKVQAGLFADAVKPFNVLIEDLAKDVSKVIKEEQ